MNLDLDLSLVVLQEFKEAVVLLNENYLIQYCNHSFSKLIAINDTELLNKSFKDFVFTTSFKNDDLKIVANKEDRVYTYLKHSTRSQINVRIRVSTVEHDSKKFYLLHVKNNTKNKIIDLEILRKTLSIELLSKSRKIRDGFFNEAIFEILQMASRVTKAARVNAWIYEGDKSSIKCIGNFDLRKQELVPQDNLIRIASPNYFKLFDTEKIIVTSNVLTDEKTKELLDNYLMPNDIKAMMDVPLRIEGEIIGVLCFEEIEGPRIWHVQDQQFALITAQMVSLALETFERKMTQGALEKAVSQQKILLREIHHRVKNNLAIITSLVNLQSQKAKDSYHEQLFIDTKNRLSSISLVHQALYSSKNFSSINIKEFLGSVLHQLQSSFSNVNQSIKIITDIQECEFDISTAIPISLITNELITNSFKHAFKNNKSGQIKVALKCGANSGQLTISDNGPGFDYSKKNTGSLGLEIIEGLVEQIQGKMKVENNKGVSFTITFNSQN